ncbi:MAG: LacI family DNA-binding transcriptional regulator [Candidatus Competibacteraceae bacterium]|uniref:Transcriptional regulator lacI family protein n=1 Tax=Candidatus Contendobacter odensis Run_B_J11 TaxID=1400861 RepID=A0A7U7GAI3_9GAMM|nr:LacI family DNA-binding transcriptional regulator [Candidatus Contendobacter odensis]MBK8537568.1 LacI family DNA-binding transcriptional regulator [Candidatus Competibacteraceae bacterium]MBK8751440.1 LacI family DNA-binding transcriptional regulator [Candidatus Competibacteraceae bacterium]CDH44586.1 Transcriptional regulator lacI family protein [Candidatus Contendobacter odensis Run_B_J11]
MARIKEVAAQAKVSVASVSRVMAGHAGVTAATRQRVLDAIKALDYRPDLAARRLRSRRTDTVGLIVSDIRNPFFTEVSRAVEDVAYQNRMRVILCNADEDPEKEALYLDLMQDENVSGVILSPTLPTLARFRPSDYSFPVVLVDRCDRDTAADAVVLDNVDSAYRLTSHLIEQGHRRIAFIYGATSATGRQRHEGYVTAMATHGLETLAKAVPATVEAARNAAGEWISRRSLPDALVASNGLILLGVTEALQAAKLRFPDQIALAGFDDLPWTRLVEPGITVIAQPTYDLGRATIDLLLQRIAQPAQAVRRVVLRGELRERGSSAKRRA